MKKVIRLTEGDLHGLITESVTRIINEIGVYPNGQTDLFFNQDQVDEYRSSANGRAIEALLRAERECGWRHMNSKDMGRYTEYICYPMSDYTSKDRETFMERIKAYAPLKDNIEFVCVRNTYIKSFTVRIKNI